MLYEAKKFRTTEAADIILFTVNSLPSKHSFVQNITHQHPPSPTPHPPAGPPSPPQLALHI